MLSISVSSGRLSEFLTVSTPCLTPDGLDSNFFFLNPKLSNLEVLIFHLHWMYQRHVQGSMNTLNSFRLLPVNQT